MAGDQKLKFPGHGNLKSIDEKVLGDFPKFVDEKEAVRENINHDNERGAVENNDTPTEKLDCVSTEAPDGDDPDRPSGSSENDNFRMGMHYLKLAHERLGKDIVLETEKLREHMTYVNSVIKDVKGKTDEKP